MCLVRCRFDPVRPLFAFCGLNPRGLVGETSERFTTTSKPIQPKSPAVRVLRRKIRRSCGTQTKNTLSCHRWPPTSALSLPMSATQNSPFSMTLYSKNKAWPGLHTLLNLRVPGHCVFSAFHTQNENGNCWWYIHGWSCPDPRSRRKIDRPRVCSRGPVDAGPNPAVYSGQN